MIDTLVALGALLSSIPWLNVGLAFAGLYLAYLLYRMHTGRSKFLIDDLFLDHKNKADLYKVVVAVMAVLSVYAVVKLLDADKPIETLLLGILGIFITGRAINSVFGKTEAPNPPEPPRDRDEPIKGE